MTYRVARTEEAQAEIRALSPHPRLRANKALNDLRQDYRAGDTKKLDGFGTLWRVRIGRRRIIFNLDEEQRIITILRVARREVVYEGLEDLLRDGPPGSR